MNGEINSRYKYFYDNNYRLTEERNFRGENEQESRQVYKYDANGNILEITKYDINDKEEKTDKVYLYVLLMFKLIFLAKLLIFQVLKKF